LARTDYWLKSGAVPTDTVRALINKARRKAPPAAVEAPAAT
jgi:ribosomal protein S16